MTYTVCKTLEIENGHLLSKHPDACQFPHGHSRRVEIRFEAEQLDANDMVCDFKLIEAAIGDCISRYDHAFCINSNDPQYDTLSRIYGERIVAFPGQDPTCEVMARTIFDSVGRAIEQYAATGEVRYPLSEFVRLRSVRVWETSAEWAQFEQTPRSQPALRASSIVSA